MNNWSSCCYWKLFWQVFVMYIRASMYLSAHDWATLAPLSHSAQSESICLAWQHTHNSLLYWLPYRWNSQPLYSYLINEMLRFVCWLMSVLNYYKSMKMFSIIIWKISRDWESLDFCALVPLAKVMQRHRLIFTVQNIGHFLDCWVFFTVINFGLGINQLLIFFAHTI